MDKHSRAGKNTGPDKSGLIVVGGRAALLGGRWCAISRSGDSPASAPWIRSPCTSGTSTCRVWRACAWI